MIILLILKCALCASLENKSIQLSRHGLVGLIHPHFAATFRRAICQNYLQPATMAITVIPLRI